MRTLTLGTLALLTFTAAAVPHFAPAEKSSVEKTIRTKINFEATSFAMSVDGQDLPAEALGDVTLDFEQISKLVATDRYVKSKDGRPLELDRTFDELVQTSKQSMQMPGQAEPQVEDKTEESDLESKTVRFTWNAEDEAYDKAFVDGEGDSELLAKLEEDLDFRGLLPAADAKVGDAWEIEGKDFTNLLSAGGELHFHEADKPIDDEKDDDMGRQMDENMTGKGRVTFKELREEDGLELAVITFTADLKSHAVMKTDGLKLEAIIEPEGEMLWDMKAKRIHAFDVTGKLDMKLIGDQEISMGGESKHKLHLEFELTGTMSLELTTKAL